MAQPFLSEIKLLAFDFPPRGWAFCDGQILPINQNQSLFSLLGTTYGGDGRTTFALPDLRGRAAAHMGDGFVLGQKLGEETHVLNANELPNHGHTLQASNAAASEDDPGGNAYANAFQAVYENFDASEQVQLNAGAVANTGGGQDHPNMQPFLAVRFAIALQGVFPSRN